MKPRAIWTGHLKISLITVPIRVYTALNEADRITFNQLHKDCHQRLKQHLVCPVHGKVEREHVVKGYEIEKDRFVIIEAADLEAVRLETTHTIELVQFIQPGELDPIYLDVPYFLGPDGPVSLEAFTVLREALRKAKRIGIGRVVLSGREKLVVLKPLANGLLMTTLRYASEIRQADAYFDELGQTQIDVEQIALARQLIENKTAQFDPGAFSDRYQSALLDLIKAKLSGTQPVQVAAAPPAGQVINLLQALKESVAQTVKANALPQPTPKSRKLKAALAA